MGWQGQSRYRPDDLGKIDVQRHEPGGKGDGDERNADDGDEEGGAPLERLIAFHRRFHRHRGIWGVFHVWHHDRVLSFVLINTHLLDGPRPWDPSFVIAGTRSYSLFFPASTTSGAYPRDRLSPALPALAPSARET